MSRFRRPVTPRRVSESGVVQPKVASAQGQVSGEMKRVKNDSLQSHTIFFSSEKGPLEQWLRPGESVVVPESYLTEQVKTLHRRKILRITKP